MVPRISWSRESLILRLIFCGHVPEIAETLVEERLERLDIPCIREGIRDPQLGGSRWFACSRTQNPCRSERA